MRPFQPIRSLRDQRGQMMGGYIVGILILLAITLSVIQKITAQKKTSTAEYYREQAINVAKAGFEEGTSFFRRQVGGVDLSSSPYAPSGTQWVTPWPLWPDSAFCPGPNDTDYYSQTLTPTAYNGSTVTITAGAIIRTIPLEEYSTTLAANDRHSSRLWGRFVLRRQNARNWSPGNNTMMAFSDPEAVHDMSHLEANIVPGAGQTWAIFSRAYVFTNPTDITTPAAHQGGSMLNAPLQNYLGRRLLQATASCYGEISRLNFNTPPAALVSYSRPMITVNAQGIINGGSAYAYSYLTGTTGSVGGTGTISPGSAGSGYSSSVSPSVGAVFPGETLPKLQALTHNVGYAPSMALFPSPNDVSYTTEVSTTRFLYYQGNADFLSGSAQAQLTGVGLCIITGNLTIEPGSLSTWAGLVYVGGNAVIRGPGDISGTLVVAGTTNIGAAGDANLGTVEYNADAVSNAESFLENFTINSSSIVITAN